MRRDKWYAFNYRDAKTGKFMEANSFRDTDYYSAKLQAEVYRDRLAFYNPDKQVRFTREYNRCH
ncbi:hypothetical protein SDC9_52635 [bioreactor metagenome]|uniref:Uncharacterized protein n=1 Tax=bioreactor metagenome TaxID=1076179 RepID=A0A644WR06_9ZZZZ